jgi:hypothetical protein
MIAILTDPGVGGTFLTWTIHYLAGDNEYYHARANKFLPLPNTPLNKLNAHGFRPNQPYTLSEFESLHQALVNEPGRTTLYFHNFTKNTMSDNNDTLAAIDKVKETANKIVLLELNSSSSLYQCKYTNRAAYVPRWGDYTVSSPGPADPWEDFLNHFFFDSKQAWDNANLNDVWDQREFMALNIDPHTTLHVTQNYKSEKVFYNLDAVELMTNFDNCLHALFEYLEIEICADRLEHWNLVYAEWKKVHVDRLNFMQQFDTIVDSILSGEDLDLLQFDLDIRQEAAIQHQLLYKHNLNLKTWQLIKFENTLQLHNLLEPNTCHDLSLSKIRKTASQTF